MKKSTITSLLAGCAGYGIIWNTVGFDISLAQVLLIILGGSVLYSGGFIAKEYTIEEDKDEQD